MPLLYINKKTPNIQLLFPTCYEFNCNVNYTIKELDLYLEPKEKLKLENDIELIHDKLEEYGEPGLNARKLLNIPLTLDTFCRNSKTWELSNLISLMIGGKDTILRSTLLGYLAIIQAKLPNDVKNAARNLRIIEKNDTTEFSEIIGCRSYA